MAKQNPDRLVLVLNDGERAELQRILDQALVDTHAEKRRTESPGYQSEVKSEENILRVLSEKVRRLGQ